MNYYEHHIRDYDAATAHLTWDEDLAYTRLLRWYYRKEKPLPADVKEVCRQVRATSKLQRESVENVLREFFILSDDGWHNETCDEVIARFQDGEPEREVKKANEKNRLKLHRDERAKLFKTLTDAGGHAVWNIKIDDLRELVRGISERKPATAPETPATQPATASATPDTATQAPSTNTQSPVLKPLVEQAASVPDIPSAETPQNAAALPFDSVSHRAIEIAAMLRKRGAALQASNPKVRSWAERGVTDAQILTALESAQKKRQTDNSLQPIGAGYLDTILKDVTANRARSSPRQTAQDKRADTIAELTGRNRNERTNERDITGEAERVA